MDFFKQQAASYLSKDEEKKHEAPKQESYEAPKQESYGAPKQGSHAAAAGTKKIEGEGAAPDYKELMGSATVLLNAAKGQFGGSNKEGEGAGKSVPLDKAKLADAAEDVLRAASQYGHFEGTPYEGYVKKAEDYLQSYKGRDLPDREANLGAAAEGLRDHKFEESAPTKEDAREEYPRN